MNPLTRSLTLPRLLHPAAWWLWAIGLATAASRTTNPLLLVLVVAVAGYVVSARREAGTSSPFGAFLRLGLFVIAMRVVLQALLGGGVPGTTILLRLPEVPLPAAAGGVRLGGPVSLEEVLAAVYEGARLAAVLACIGAANALASPRRLLRYVPATLYDVGTALVVALTYAPQMVDDARRVRAARRLRGHAGRGPRELARLAVPGAGRRAGAFARARRVDGVSGLRPHGLPGRALAPLGHHADHARASAVWSPAPTACWTAGPARCWGCRCSHWVRSRCSARCWWVPAATPARATAPTRGRCPSG